MKIIDKFLPILAIIFVRPILAFSATIHVPADQPTIQAGINAASDGDTVLIASGTYIENINYNGKNVVGLSEDGRDVTIIEPFDPNQSIVTFDNGEDTLCILDGFTIRNTVDAVGMVCTNSGPIIQNCDISYCYHGSGDGAGIFCINSAAKIRHNLIHNNHGHATGGGISGTGSPTPEISYNIIYENTIAHGQGIGFFGPTSNINIHHNVVRNNSGGEYGAIYINGSGCQIINNTVTTNNNGISILNGSGTIIFNNVVVSNTGKGLSPAAATYDYNNIWDNGSANDPGPNGISEDPLFFDPVNNDYTLLLESPCFNAGHPDPMYNDPDGTRNDIGAFPIEYFLPIALDINTGLSSNHDTVSTLTPEIFWSYYDTMATTQTAFEIQVGTDADWIMAELWDPGPVYADDTSIIYAGEPPAYHGKYYIRIRVNDGINWGCWNFGKFITKIGHIIIIPTEVESIQEAINIAGSGDTISVLAGTYEENIDFSGKALLLVGQEGKSNTVLSPANPDIATIRMVSGEQPGTEIRDFTIAGGGPTNTVVIAGEASILINYCTFYNNIPVGTSNREVISIGDATAIITRNLFYGNGGIGCVGLRGGADNSWIINNTFDGNQRGFFSIADGGYAINNIVTNSIERGVGCLSGSNFTILDYNDVWNNNPNYDVGGVEGPNSISVDPQYNDPANHDYTLYEVSLCIDAGDPDPVYNDPDGSRCDLGAFPAGTFICGDVDNNDALNLLDITYLIRFLYQGGQPPYSVRAADANGDGFINIIDITYLIDYLYKGGPEPACP